MKQIHDDIIEQQQRHTFVSGSVTKVNTNENIVKPAMSERVPGVLRGEARRTGNTCAGMNAARNRAPAVRETAIPTKKRGNNY